MSTTVALLGSAWITDWAGERELERLGGSYALTGEFCLLNLCGGKAERLWQGSAHRGGSNTGEFERKTSLRERRSRRFLPV